ncbi:unnamed protein product [Schistosoma mattheei]|uniref:Uncharacterized protein n=1 Tax=Schistosoma mattheei TaxID=31246 RepID=A0A183NGF1_9TREM|nr:unnamed protein product [Schistosoma mattheei]
MVSGIAFLMNRATPPPLRFCILSGLTNVKPSKSSSILSIACVSQVSVTAIMSGFVELICAPSSDPLLSLKSTVQYVPESCCVLKSHNLQFNSFSEIQSQSGVFLDRELCIGYKSLTTRDDIAPRIDNPLYTTRSNTYLYEKGCVTVVRQEYQQYSIMLAASGTTALALSIVGFILSLVLLFHIEYQQFVRISTDWNINTSTINIQSSIQDNISTTSKQLSENEVLVKA